MPYIGPIVILLLVLSPVLIPLMITVCHKAAGATKRSERAHGPARRRMDGETARVRGSAMKNVVRTDDRREVA
jgi:hypothetical protein